MFRNRLLQLAGAFMALSITSLMALAQEPVTPQSVCIYQQTVCSNGYCEMPDGSAGAPGEHVYFCYDCPTPNSCVFREVQTVPTCCGGT